MMVDANNNGNVFFFGIMQIYLEANGKNGHVKLVMWFANVYEAI